MKLSVCKACVECTDFHLYLQWEENNPSAAAAKKFPIEWIWTTELLIVLGHFSWFIHVF